MQHAKVALVGMGTIGRGWAILYARAGFDVAVYDPDPAALADSRTEIESVLAQIEQDAGARAAALVRISLHSSLGEAADGAIAVQESVPEQLEIKRKVLAEIESACPADALILSSCSSLSPDALFAHLSNRSRAMVAHPFNPPYLLRLVELVASEDTAPALIEAARWLMGRIGQIPIVVQKFVSGYVANRLQAAVINEAMHLVDIGAASAADIDLCMTEALGPRWAMMGPFETMDLNADEGVAAYAAKFGTSYNALGRELGVGEPWSTKALAAVVAERRAAVPLEALGERRRWRDQQLLEVRNRAEQAKAAVRTVSDVEA